MIFYYGQNFTTILKLLGYMKLSRWNDESVKLTLKRRKSIKKNITITMQPYENGKKKVFKDRIKWQALNKTRVEWNNSYYTLISYLSNKYGNFSNYTMHTLSKHDAPFCRITKDRNEKGNRLILK